MKMENTVLKPSADHIRNADWYRIRLEYMNQFALPERIDNLRRVLGMRTRRMTVCMENTFHPQNASALVRTCEAFGVQDIHTIETLCRFNPNVNIVKGTDKWVDIKRHKSPTEAIKALKETGYRIVATTPHIGDHSPADFDVTSSPFALVFGTEHAGVSDEIIAAADDFIRIPMYGFVESLNVSASAAILLHTLTERMRSSGIEWQLSEEESLPLLFNWVMESINDSERILAREFQE